MKENERNVKRTKIVAKAPYFPISSWIKPGSAWPRFDAGYIFPTAMKSIVRRQPPPKPAGISRISRCCAGTLGRWEADSYRDPPCQYKNEFVIWSANGKWRLCCAEERELLLGDGGQHTEICSSASTIKTNKQEYEDIRCSLLGDSFSIFSFVIAGGALCCDFLLQDHYQHLQKDGFES